ncbi:MAG: family 10 glycosylhydrolase [Bacteroidales bacterium]|nr:family 10 glycosylhydrolase [Bacteroidales bacterium]
MKSLLKFIILAALLLGVAQASAQVKREQRSVWMSAYVNDWPSSKITESNVNTLKTSCQKMLDTLAANNMNAVYFHVRAMCDAMYKSAYEPWSSYIVAKRGDVPALDPLEWIVQEAHKRGIELYAWVNPYRYAPSGSSWGQSELDYIHTHPEWLLTTDYETVLNPGIPEVRQRVVDVCRDIIMKYDVDGLVFDDYFYNQGGCDFSLDADLYNDYKAKGGTLTQGDWRRENVNQMVADVNAMIRATKPWVRFGIGPAGVACSSPEVAKKYGVDPSPGTDWQYNQIYSDPMAWVTRGTIDFISPQVYWNTAGNFDEVTQWWGKIGKKFNRHVYISQTCSSFGKDGWDLNEFTNQVQVMRDAGNLGMVYFKYTTWRNNNGVIDGKTWALRRWLKHEMFTTPALCPSPSWTVAPIQYGTVTNCRREGDVLRWDAVENVRYAIYAIPDAVADADFHCQAQYLLGFTYPNEYAIKAAYAQGYRFAVTILDRWEHEFAPVLAGSESRPADKPVITAPADGATVPMLSRLAWRTNGTLHTVEVFADADCQQPVAHVEVGDTTLSITDIPGLKPGTYYWRVSSRGLNLSSTTSDVRSFTCEKMRITSPAQGAASVLLTPEITWSKAAEGTVYTLNISSKESMASPEYVVETNQVTHRIPKFKLAGGTTYYAQVVARLGEAVDQSEVSSFTTLNVVPAVPVFVSPAADGVTLRGNNVISVEPEEGAQSLRLEICNSNTFPARSTWKATLDEGVFASVPIAEMTGTGKPVDGKAYYVRARYAYGTAGSTTVNYTDYSPVLKFNYVAAPLVGDVNGDGAVNVSDVTALINKILGTSDYPDAICDINADGVVNVSDVTALINLILG